MDQLEAVVDATLFRNDQNGYSVIRATAGRSHCFVVGTFPELVAGEQAIFTGEWTEHPRYGKQFRAETIQILKPTSVLGIRRFLSSRRRGSACGRQQKSSDIRNRRNGRRLRKKNASMRMHS